LALARKAGTLLDDFEVAWQSGATGLLESAVGRAVGLGLGLTPSGDDFLTGLVAAAHFWPPAEEHSGERDRHQVLEQSLYAAIEARLGSTTLASAFMLRAALDLRFSEPLLSLLSGLDRADVSAAGSCVREMIGLGATSGRDMLAGVLFGLEVSEIGERCYETSAP
jgi:hypothetical protein